MYKKIKRLSIGYDPSLKLEELSGNKGRKGGYTRVWFTPDSGYEIVLIKDDVEIPFDFDVMHVIPKQHKH